MLEHYWKVVRTMQYLKQQERTDTNWYEQGREQHAKTSEMYHRPVYSVGQDRLRTHTPWHMVGFSTAQERQRCSYWNGCSQPFQHLFFGLGLSPGSSCLCRWWALRRAWLVETQPARLILAPPQRKRILRWLHQEQIWGGGYEAALWGGQ